MVAGITMKNWMAVNLGKCPKNFWRSIDFVRRKEEKNI
jgi:hypothetical protein